MLSKLPNCKVVLDSSRGDIDLVFQRMLFQSDDTQEDSHQHPGQQSVSIRYLPVGDLQIVAAKQFVRQFNSVDWINTRLDAQAMESIGGHIPDLIQFSKMPTNPATLDNILEEGKDFILSKIPTPSTQSTLNYTLKELREVLKMIVQSNQTNRYSSIRTYNPTPNSNPDDFIGVFFEGVSPIDLTKNGTVSISSINSMIESGIIYYDPSSQKIKIINPKVMHILRSFPEIWLTGIGKYSVPKRDLIAEQKEKERIFNERVKEEPLFIIRRSSIFY